MDSPPVQLVRHLVIEGRVQGVGFRWFARERARRRGLRGWVQNRPDGAVQVLVSGQADVLEEFISNLRRGPEGSYVTHVRDIPAPRDMAAPEDIPFPFQIQRSPRA